MSSPKSAIHKLLKKLEKHPNSLVFSQLAEEYRKEGMLQEALQTCREGLKRHPKYWSARVTLARVQHQLGQADEARAELENVIKAVPENLTANRLLADIYLESNDYQHALEQYKLVHMQSSADTELQALINKLEEQTQSKMPQDAVEEVPSSLTEDAGISDSSLPDRSSDTQPGTLNTTDSHAGAAVGYFLPSVKELISDDSNVCDGNEPNSGTPEQTQALADRATFKSDDADELTSETLAELYLQQGLTAKAIQVYERLLLSDPGNDKILKRLQALVTSEENIDNSTELEGLSKQASLPSAENQAEVHIPAPFVQTGNKGLDERRRKIALLEYWLAVMRKDRS